MAYYIFLKSFRILEEFRKNPHIKIPPKSPTNFQSLSTFKNQIFIRKRIFPSPSAQLAQWPVGPSRHLRPPLNTSRCHPSGLTPPPPPPSIPPLTPHYAASPSMVLRPLPPAVSPPPPAAPLLPAPIKGRGAPLAITTLTPALLCSLPSPQPRPHRAPTAAAISFCRPATSPQLVLW
jgi:hypothetical protein